MFSGYKKNTIYNLIHVLYPAAQIPMPTLDLNAIEIFTIEFNIKMKPALKRLSAPSPHVYNISKGQFICIAQFSFKSDLQTVIYVLIHGNSIPYYVWSANIFSCMVLAQ